MSEYCLPFDKDKGGEFDGVCEEAIVCEEAAAIRKEAVTSVCVVCSMSIAFAFCF